MELTQTVESIKDMDQKELTEALPRLREEAAKAEETLRVAQARVRLANRRLEPVLSFVEVRKDHILIDCRGKDRVSRFLGCMKIPLEHVVRAEAAPEIEWDVWRKWRFQGTRMPDAHAPGVRFYNMHGRRDKTISIWLKNEDYEQRIMEVQEPAKVVEEINNAVDALSRSR